jgi:acylphosphatase
VPVRKHVYYYGTVQGVGFRYTARRLAQEQGIAGFVRNLADGRVELAAEGEPAAVGAYLDSLDAAMGRTIERADVTDEPVEGGRGGFRVSFEEG